MQKKLANQFLQSGKMLFESRFANFGKLISGIGFSPDKLLFGLNILYIFQGFQMTGKISVGNLKQVFHGIEISKFVYRQDRHNSQADTAIENLIQIGYYTRHCFLLSYLRYIVKP